jgi:hypothetical protein
MQLSKQQRAAAAGWQAHKVRPLITYRSRLYQFTWLTARAC